MTNNIGKVIFYFSISIISLGLLLSVSNTILASQSQTENDIVRALAWSPDGSVLAVGGIINGQIGVFLLRDQLPTIYFKTSGNVLSIAWSPDGTKLASRVLGEVDGVQIRDMEGKEKLLTMSELGPVTTFKIAWSPNSTNIAFEARDSLISWGKDRRNYTYANNAQQIQTFAWHPSGKQIFIAGADKAIRLWDIPTNAVIHEQKSSSFIASMATSPDGTKLALGGSDGTVQVWDLATDDTLYTFQAVPERKDVVWNLEWSHDGQIIVAAGARYAITLWDANTGQLLDTIEKQAAGFLKDVTLSPYGGRLAYSTDRYGAGSPPLKQTIFDDYTESILDGAIQIAVPTPSLEKLQSIIQACKVQPSVQKSLMVQISADNLNDFVAEVSALTDTQMSQGCKADLLAVAHALMAKAS